MTAPTVAVVIPSYQSARFLAEAIDSVLAQSRPVAEVVVVDDGSTDASVGVARRYGPAVRVIAQANQGAGAARMVGLRATNAPLVGFLDADDRWRPDAMDVLGGELGRRPDALLAVGAVEPFVDEDAVDGARRGSLAAGPAFLLSSTLIRRNAFEVVGPFTPGNFSAIEWFMKVQEQGLVTATVDVVVADRRIHDANTSSTPHVGAVYARMLKASLDRRRGSARGPKADAG